MPDALTVGIQVIILNATIEHRKSNSPKQPPCCKAYKGNKGCPLYYTMGCAECQTCPIEQLEQLRDELKVSIGG